MATQMMEREMLIQTIEHYLVEEPEEKGAGLVRIDAPGLTTGELWVAEPGPRTLPYIDPQLLERRLRSTEMVKEPEEKGAGLVRIDAPGLTTGELWVAEPGPSSPLYKGSDTSLSCNPSHSSP